MAIVYCDRCDKVVKVGSGAKAKVEFANKRQGDWKGTLCVACGQAVIRSATRKPPRRVAR